MLRKKLYITNICSILFYSIAGDCYIIFRQITNMLYDFVSELNVYYYYMMLWCQGLSTPTK